MSHMFINQEMQRNANKLHIELFEKEEQLNLQAIKVVLATFEKNLKQTNSSV